MAEVVIDVVGRDGFTGTLGNLGNIITGIKSAIDLVSDAFRVASDFVGQFVNSASESQQAVFELEAVLKATGGAAGFTSEELQNMADGLQNVTRFSDETILSGVSMLLTFRNIGEETFPRATNAMLDMATMFGSVDTAAVQLGKALNDPIAGIGALQRIGIQFTEEQKTMIENFVKTGDVAAAQNIILKEVEMQIGGLAVAMGETFAGKIDIMKNKLDSLKELIGGPIMAVLGELLGFFMEKWDSLMNSEWPPIRILENLNDNLDAGMPILQAFGFAFKDLFELTPEQEALFDSVGGFFLTLQSALDNNQEPLQAFITAFDYLSRSDGPLAGFGQAITNVLLAFDSGGILAAVDTFVAELANALTNEINTWINSDGPEELSETIISWFDDIGTGTEFDSKAAAAAGNLLAALKKAVGEIKWIEITDAIDAALARIIEDQEWYESGKAFGDSLADALLGGVGPGIESKESEAIPAIGQGIGNWIRGAIGDVYFEHSSQDIAAAFVNLFIDKVKTNFATSVQWSQDVAATIANKLITAIKNNFATSVQWTQDVAASIANGLINGLNSIELNITDWVRTHIIDPVKRFLGIASPSTVFFQIGKDIITGLLDGLKGSWNTVSTWIETKLSDLLSNFSLENILAVITGDMSLSELFGGGTTGTTGGGAGDTSHDPRGGGTGTTLTGTTTNTFNFYGTVYMSGVGPEGTFDCPSPHPIMIASSQSLLTSGVA